MFYIFTWILDFIVDHRQMIKLSSDHDSDTHIKLNTRIKPAHINKIFANIPKVSRL